MKRIKPKTTDDPVLALKEAKRLLLMRGRIVKDGGACWENAGGKELSQSYVRKNGACRFCAIGAASVMTDSVPYSLYRAANRLGFNLGNMTNSYTRKRLTKREIACLFDIAIAIEKGRTE